MLYRWHLHLSAGVAPLPEAPPSLAAARLLDQPLLPRLPADARAALARHCVELCVTDLGLLGAASPHPAAGQKKPVLRIAARGQGYLSQSYLKLLRGEYDPDRMAFERCLGMEGAAELGLVIKNTLDAIGPLWPRR